ncbi:UDP-N-acetylmuramoyl-tripeptide--D-alanyl-D-alanine ligase [Flavobacterium sp. TP390]|uniref:UDP-N-acetylmuramoyl-tripeptide--D-alanyl-D-alanine ligase n=1 Tax=Flavobacterium profundi TaxID=1774945 RepID=A0A6I4IES3_9FLAO|nr:UDP-N-acetylmuramoyl-tripeptide--D-alanyl-D-alanine ligase [Flavobacterium profundi]MVO07950.1 UDP-N-acetylmuramoyl-tripeptide--D-alanyl-D-alanine ligase [Flavobacterium profundi]
MNIQELYDKFLECRAVTTDTRKIAQNDLFFALKGTNFDANLFAKEALEKGAKYVVIDNKDYFIENKTILVPDTLKTLQELANYHRRVLNTKIIALTGSNGKTTTKELINSVLSKKYRTTATIGNLNNHIGVPLTLLSFNKDTEIGIVEMGANHKKEIEFLCELAEPDFGYITNFGKAHLEGFGGVEGVIEGKSELYKYIENNEKICFVNLDDTIQNEKTKHLKRFTFSTNKDSDVKITNITANPMVSVTYENLVIQSHLIGIYNANNINIAITIGNYFSIASNLIKQAIENYIPTNNRSQLLKKDSNEIILDAYNANPSSMAAAVQNFTQLEHSNKIIVFGDMFELGAESTSEHQKLISSLQNEAQIRCYFVGNEFYQNKIEQSNFSFFKTFEDFSTIFLTNKPQNALLLIKGSRGMALERTLELL